MPIALAKQSRQGKRVESFFFPSFSLNTTLCPVSTLWVYLEKTAPLREEERKLFISFIKPHKAVTSSSIARWLRLILENAALILPYLEHIPHEEHRHQQHSGLVLQPVTYSKQQTGVLNQSFKNSTTKKWTKQHTVEQLLPRIARSQLQTTQLMCETEPSDI